MKNKGGKGVLFLGLGLVAVIIVILIVFTNSKNFNFVMNKNSVETTTKSSQSTTQEAKNDDGSEKTTASRAYSEPDYNSALTKTFTCEGENFGGELIINSYDDMNFSGDDFKLIRCLLVSPSGKNYRVDLSEESEEVTILSTGASYTFRNPIEQGNWKMIIYGDNLTDTGTNAFLSVDYVSGD